MSVKKTVLITGANGMLAKQLAKHLQDSYSIRFLTRKKTSSNEYEWNIREKYIDPNAFNDVDIIIHLAGSSIAEKRWTKKRKQLILSSRIDSSNLILEELKKNKKSLDLFISASAIGIYGTVSTDTIFDERSENGSDFLSDVCVKWEDSAHAFSLSNKAERLAIIRIGVILAKNDGALKKMSTPIKYGIGAVIGNGNQYVPWIHIDDLCSIFKFTIENKQISGAYNAVAPEHITNYELTKEIGKKLNRRILLPNIPKFIMKLIFGQMSSILLFGSRVSSNKLIQSGFSFKYKKLKHALSKVL